MSSIGFYEGPWAALGNFSAHQVIYDGVQYSTAEHAYQVAKFSDPEMRELIQTTPSAYLARVYGQAQTGRTEQFDKVLVLKNIMRAKFQQHADARQALLRTGDSVIVKNHPGDDGFWGLGQDGMGRNVMGQLLMELREEFRSENNVAKIIYTEQPENFLPKFTCAAAFVEADGDILLLQRRPEKDEGNRWGLVAGKVEQGEITRQAVCREIYEETGRMFELEAMQHVMDVYVRYPEYDFIFSMFRVRVSEQFSIQLEAAHKNYVWVTPSEALAMDLVKGTFECVGLCYPDIV